MLGELAELRRELARMGTIKSNNLSAEESLQENGANYRLLVKNLPNVVFKGYKDWSVDFIDDKQRALFRRFDSARWWKSC